MGGGGVGSERVLAKGEVEDVYRVRRSQVPALWLDLTRGELQTDFCSTSVNNGFVFPSVHLPSRRERR